MTDSNENGKRFQALKDLMESVHKNNTRIVRQSCATFKPGAFVGVPNEERSTYDVHVLCKRCGGNVEIFSRVAGDAEPIVVLPVQCPNRRVTE